MKKVFVISHERSGTHFLINSLAANFGYSADQIDIMTKADVDLALAHPQVERVYKAHHQSFLFSDHIEEMARDSVIFYVMREGKDVMTSSWQYHYIARPTVKDFFPRVSSLSDWMRTNPQDFYFDNPYSVRKSANMVSRWKAHLESWINNKHSFTIRYEDLSNDFDSMIDNIGVALDAAPAGHVRPTLRSSRSVNPRKGIVGNWEEFFTPEDLQYYEEQVNDSRFYEDA